MPTITVQPQASSNPLTPTPFDMTGGGAQGSSTSPPQGAPEQNTPNEAQGQKPDALSPQLAALARRERAIRQQHRALQAEKQSLASRQAEIENNVHTQWKAKLAASPWDAMIEAGLTPDQATDIILNKPKPEDLQMQSLQREIESIKKSQDDSVNMVKAHQADQYNQAKKHMALQAKMLVNADTTYEPIKTTGAVGAIPQLIEDVFNQGLPGKHPPGFLMDLDEAAQLVNEHIIEEGVRIAKLAAVQQRIAPQAPQRAMPSQKPYTLTQKQPNYPSTLSNTMSAHTQTNRSERERRERAILAYQGKLG